MVDDSRVIRKVARRILEALDFECAEAGDGAEALAYCRADMPDAVLLDRNMPVMNGVDFLRQLRAEPRGTEPVVMFCSADTELSIIHEALTAGADEYIMKPFDGDILGSKFEQMGLLR